MWATILLFGVLTNSSNNSEVLQASSYQLSWMAASHEFLKKPVDVMYHALDEVPSFLRRPFKRSLGFFLDQVQSIPGLVQELYYKNYGMLGRANQPLIGYPQAPNACAEQATGMLLRAYGFPTVLNLDTQSVFGGGSGLITMEFLRRGLLSFTGHPKSVSVLKSYVSMGYSPIVSTYNPVSKSLHYVTVTGYDAWRIFSINQNDYEYSQWDFQGKFFRNVKYMTVVAPQRSFFIEQLANNLSLRKINQEDIVDGFSISDLWYDWTKNWAFVELAYKFTVSNFVVTTRVNSAYSMVSHYDQKNESSERPSLIMVKEPSWGGNLKIDYFLTDDSKLSFQVEHTTGDVRGILPMTSVLEYHNKNIDISYSLDSKMNMQAEFLYNDNGIYFGINMAYAKFFSTTWLFASVVMEGTFN